MALADRSGTSSAPTFRRDDSVPPDSISIYVTSARGMCSSVGKPIWHASRTRRRAPRLRPRSRPESRAGSPHARSRIAPGAKSVVVCSLGRFAEKPLLLRLRKPATELLVGRGRPIRLWQPLREGERNAALDAAVYAIAAAPAKGAGPPARPAKPPRVIRSRWVSSIPALATVAKFPIFWGNQ